MKKIYSLFLALTGTFFLNAQTINTVAGNGIAGSAGDGGQATAANLSSPLGIAIAPNGVMYISDGANHKIRKVDVAGVITTFGGTGTAGYNGDNILATNAQFNTPSALAFDSQGDLYVADYQNYRIRKITMSTGMITTVAGSGSLGFAGDNAAATLASLSSPTGVCFDANDNMYIADQGNARVRRVDHLTGIITTVAGDGSSTHTGDGGQGTLAGIGNVYDVKCDPAGNVIFSEVFNHYIRKVNMTTGIISTICGSGVAAFFGDGGQANLASIATPEGIEVDGAGNVFIAELNNDRIRKIDAITGIISTVAGSGSYAYTGDGGPATSAGMWPDAVGVNGTDLYIVDLNNAIRKVGNTATEGIQQNHFNSSDISVFPNPTSDYFSISGVDSNSPMQIFDMNGNLVRSEMVNENEPIDIRNLSDGIYFVVVKGGRFKIVK